MAAFGVVSNCGKGCILVITTPVTKVKRQTHSPLERPETVVEFRRIAKQWKPVFGSYTHATDKGFHRKCFERRTAPRTAS